MENTPLTKRRPFTPDDVVILMVDYQSGIAKFAQSQPIKEVIDNALKLLALAKVYDIPVIFTSSEEALERKGKIFNVLQTPLPDVYAHRVKRTGVIDAMTDPDFRKQINQTGRQNLVIGGISTEECVSLPAISAQLAGYNVSVIADACASYSSLTDNIQFSRLLARQIDVTTIRQFIADMLGDWSSEQAQAYQQLSTQLLATN
ncbi:isochorismatase family protein [Periweissella ghanensis]|uniref:Hydrolase YcaC n=1 Tax=Periweissella ghanensis TaxID=467997 RepID=A0ABN8BMT2_9LACO|nr:isochorismatase family protein [Periweissella ghanensis]MCM0600445.1 isochorismatase family protein [Periweissella ghanensis]CAH0418091.1 putative hydrolase YcaC [Periweissella ghanensis]